MGQITRLAPEGMALAFSIKIYMLYAYLPLWGPQQMPMHAHQPLNIRKQVSIQSATKVAGIYSQLMAAVL
jgi:hypothetical protein